MGKAGAKAPVFAPVLDCFTRGLWAKAHSGVWGKSRIWVLCFKGQRTDTYPRHKFQLLCPSWTRDNIKVSLTLARFEEKLDCFLVLQCALFKWNWILHFILKSLVPDWGLMMNCQWFGKLCPLVEFCVSDKIMWFFYCNSV